MFLGSLNGNLSIKLRQVIAFAIVEGPLIRLILQVIATLLFFRRRFHTEGDKRTGKSIEGLIVLLVQIWLHILFEFLLAGVDRAVEWLTKNWIEVVESVTEVIFGESFLFLVIGLLWVGEESDQPHHKKDNYEGHGVPEYVNDPLSFDRIWIEKHFDYVPLILFLCLIDQKVQTWYRILDGPKEVVGDEILKQYDDQEDGYRLGDTTVSCSELLIKNRDVKQGHPIKVDHQEHVKRNNQQAESKCHKANDNQHEHVVILWVIVFTVSVT